jgi:hypothetical protein
MMDSDRKVGVRFADPQTFGRACETLRGAQVTFSLAGFQTVVLSEVALKSLAEPIATWPGASKFPVSPGDEKRPPLPNRQQTEEILRRLAKDR